MTYLNYNSYKGREWMNAFKSLGSLFTNHSSIHENLACRDEGGDSCYYSVQTFYLLDFSLIIRKLEYIEQ